MKVSILGAGSWGTALSILLSENGHEVSVWSILPDEVQMLNTEREHKEKLPGAIVPSGVVFTAELEDCLKNTSLVVLVVPSQKIRETARKIAGTIDSDTVVAICSKGLEENTGFRLSEIAEQELGAKKVVALIGPSHAEEVAMNMPTIVAASQTGKRQSLFRCVHVKRFRYIQILISLDRKLVLH